MTITAEQVYLLNNKFGALAHKVQLGTLIQNAESIVASEIALADGKVLIGNASGIAAAQTLSGDVTVDRDGVAAIAAGAVVNADINASAAIAFSKLASLTSGRILVGSAGNVPTEVAMSGDATIVASGALTIANLAVTGAKLAADAVSGADKIADDAVSLEHLDAGITPGFLIVDAGIFTTVGGDANESIPSANTLGTDTAIVWVQKAGATPRTVDTITPGAGSVAVVLSGDPSNDHKLAWVVLRAPA